MTVLTSCDVRACVAVKPHQGTRILKNIASSLGLFAVWVAPFQFATASGVAPIPAGGDEAPSASRSLEVSGRGSFQTHGLDASAQHREAPVRLHSNREAASYLVNGFDADHEASVSRRQMMRSVTENSVLETTPSSEDGVKSLEDGMQDGLAANACRNYKNTGQHKTQVSCPAPLKMAGCSCRDKVPEKMGACSTKFMSGETCGAFTQPTNNITAYVRCCNFKYSLNMSIETSELSGENDGDGVRASCPANVTLLGCACATSSEQAGCKMTRVVASGEFKDTCEATKHSNPAYPLPGGVKAQALCGVIPFSQDWESVSLTTHTQEPQNMSSGLKCGDETSEMISCSCGSAYGECGGGKVLGNKCECWGYRCFASARCAKVPVPAEDCVWTDWGEWSTCSASCGAGTKSRVREVAMVARYGGKDCTGPTNHIFDCEGEGTDGECALKIRKKTEAKNDNTMLIYAGAGCGGLVLLLGAGLAYHHHSSKAKLAQEKGLAGEGGGAWGEYGSWGGYGEAQGEAAGAEATAEAPAEDEGEEEEQTGY